MLVYHFKLPFVCILIILVILFVYSLQRNKQSKSSSGFPSQPALNSDNSRRSALTEADFYPVEKIECTYHVSRCMRTALRYLVQQRKESKATHQRARKTYWIKNKEINQLLWKGYKGQRRKPGWNGPDGVGRLLPHSEHRWGPSPFLLS